MLTQLALKIGDDLFLLIAHFSFFLQLAVNIAYTNQLAAVLNFTLYISFTYYFHFGAHTFSS